MVVSSSDWRIRRQQRIECVKREAVYLCWDYGVDAPQEALRRQSEANSWSSARYWSRVQAETHHVRDCGGGAPFDGAGAATTIESEAAWLGRAEAQDLARAIESARIHCADDDLARSRPERRRSAQETTLPDLSRRSSQRAFARTTARPLRLESSARAVAGPIEARVMAFPRG